MDKGNILLVQVYVDNIIFGSTKKSLCTEFESLMHKKLHMSSIGEPTFFLGLQVNQKDNGIFISQDKFVADILKKFDFFSVKTASTSLETNKALIKDVDVNLYRSMIGSLMYLTDKTIYKEWEDIMERAATTASSLDVEQDSGAKIPYWEVQMIKLGLRLHLNSPMIHLSQEVTHLEVGRTLSIRGDLHLEDADGTDCLPTATIFKELARMGAKPTAWNGFSSTIASAIICLATNQKFNLSKYIFDAMKKQSRRKQKKTTAVPHPSDSTTDVPNEEYVPTHSNDPLLSGEDRLKLTDLMDMCTKLYERVLDLEHTKTAQAQEITNLKLRVKKLEKKTGLRTHKFKRLYKVGVTRRVEYSNDESLGAQVDAFNQGRSIEDIDKDAEVSLDDETQGRSDDTDALIGNKVFAENDMIKKDQDVTPKEVSIAAPSTIDVSPPVITESTATTAPSTIPKAKGITFRDADESTTRTPTSVSSLSINDKGKAKMDKPEVPLKKKDQIALDKEMARNLKAQLQAELIEEERLARKKEEKANIALIES
ncbi:retrovirus-related pol polyprotein from transposon TNT 1-94, partial [Tanacetum coccineum]